ncbi:hypothetical protein EMIHUDRAFT_115134 [Emiliania huxleyi CCMP1516]|uniref:S1 motif domain-containing protein n=2 Tax=Emiliania huxleyi TaxID=2903 RepID=A0A0D3JRR7_EMIH1|nr:hypothetical protein EMIHUDRAFT_115134 [Emiliania huxleyi CCMP1516]EOD26202.1 hypothetical protein EMIHUDRAFT_115134 [Emiliania huxleyi CCMP1516]|eukprot:XP_005778631.1 hypothetical protein EMIHUDRAFT_115134 [Emiliania huxleyi CCMP1516]
MPRPAGLRVRKRSPSPDEGALREQALKSQLSARNPRRERSRSRSNSEERLLSSEPSVRAAARAEKARERERDKPFATGTVVEGTVSSVREFGVFVRLPGRDRDGLLHISQASDKRISAEELRLLYPVGKALSVKVLSVAPDGKLSLSAIGADKLQAGGKPPPPPEVFSIHRAEVLNGTDFAIFARLESGWEVMVHESQLDEGKLRSVKAKRPSDYYHRGMQVWLKVSDLQHAKDGQQVKAKLQGSFKYVDQQSGADLDSPPSGGGGGGGGGGDGGGEGFVAAAGFDGRRDGYVFKLGSAGLGYYLDGAGRPPAAGGKPAKLAAMLAAMEAEEAARKERKKRKREKKERRREKKERKKKERRRGEASEEEARGKGKRRRSSSSSESSGSEQPRR